MVKKKDPPPSALEVKTCIKKVRDAGKHVPCPGKFLKGTTDSPGVCPESERHLLKMPSGFCLNGWCEGTKAVTYKGDPAPTCKMILTCPCKCHDTLDKLFAMTEQERLVVESSGYAPPKRTYWLPSDEPDMILSRTSDPMPPVVIESPAPDLVPATIERTFAPTATGRAAKGELESWVNKHCGIWLIDQPGVPCTPAYLADEIARDQGITPPSVGAISACFERWIKLGYAVVQKKPTRFVAYTEEGKKYGLEKMKADAKRAAKLAQADNRRNLR